MYRADHGALEHLEVLPHVLANQLHPSKFREAIARCCEVSLGDNLADNAASLGQRHQAHVTGVGKFVMQQNLKEAQLHLADFIGLRETIPGVP
jgi:hypothetical protein